MSLECILDGVFGVGLLLALSLGMLMDPVLVLGLLMMLAGFLGRVILFTWPTRRSK